MTVLLSGPILTGRQVYYYGDFSSEFYPFKLLMARALTEGYIPFWDPATGGGIPISAGPEGGIVYPLNFLLSILPFHMGLGFFIALHYLLAGIFTYLLLKEWKVSSVSSLIGVISFVFGGIMVSSVYMINVLQTATWLPMLIFCFQRSIRRSSGIYLVLSGLAMALMFYGGEVHLTYISMMVLFLWVAKETLLNTLSNWRYPASLQPMLTFILITMLGILLSLPFLLPIYELFSLSTRSTGVSMESASMFGLRPGGLMGFISPSLFFDTDSFTSWHNITGRARTTLFLSYYVGFMPFILAVLGIITHGMKRDRFLLILLALTLLAAMGSNTPLFSIVRRFIPFMDTLRFPEKFLIFSVLFLAIFSGLGAETILGWSSDGVKRGKTGWKAHRPIFWLPLCIIIAIFVLGFGTASKNRLISLIQSVNVFNVSLSNQAEDYTEYIHALTKDVVVFIVLATILILLILLARKKIIGRAVLGFTLLALTCLDLFMAHSKLNDTMPEDFYLNPPEIVSSLKNEKEPYRIMRLIPVVPHIYEKSGTLPAKIFSDSKDIKGVHIIFPSLKSLSYWNKEALMPNIGTIYGIQYAMGYTSLRLETQQRFINYIKRAPPEIGDRLLEIYNVKYILMLRQLEKRFNEERPNFQLVRRFEKTGLLLYRNSSTLPRVYFVPNARMVGSDEEALSAISNKDFEPLKEIIITMNDPVGQAGPKHVGLYAEAPSGIEDSGPLNRRGLPEGELELLEYRDSLVSVMTDFGQGGYLILSDAYYPGWKVSIDHKEAELLRGNYLFKAVKLPPGKHLVNFSYTPHTFIKGVYLGLGIASICIILILVLYPKIWRPTERCLLEKCQR